MTLLLKQLFTFLKILNSETGTNQIASGITAGFILGMGPFLSLQGLLIFLSVLIFRIQFGAVLISAFFFAFIAWIFGPLFNSIGLWALNLDTLQGPWTTLYNLPLMPFTLFNNSVVMGAAITSLILAPLIFILAKLLVSKYRTLIVERFKQTKTWKLIKATALYKWYYKYDSLYN